MIELNSTLFHLAANITAVNDARHPLRRYPWRNALVEYCTFFKKYATPVLDVIIDSRCHFPSNFIPKIPNRRKLDARPRPRGLRTRGTPYGPETPSCRCKIAVVKLP